MKELYRRHYEFVVSLLSAMISEGRFVFDSRWLKLFKELDVIYGSFKKIDSHSNRMIYAENVDREMDYFPPCMTSLLAILRDQHRLSYYWRYMLGCFLRDIGMPLNEAIQFWKNEYSKNHSCKTRCRHTWDNHSKKYIYSVKHQYGLIGDRKIRKTKPCEAIQVNFYKIAENFQ